MEHSGLSHPGGLALVRELSRSSASSPRGWSGAAEPGAGGRLGLGLQSDSGCRPRACGVFQAVGSSRAAQLMGLTSCLLSLRLAATPSPCSPPHGPRRVGERSRRLGSSSFIPAPGAVPRPELCHVARLAVLTGAPPFGVAHPPELSARGTHPRDLASHSVPSGSPWSWPPCSVALSGRLFPSPAQSVHGLGRL